MNINSHYQKKYHWLYLDLDSYFSTVEQQLNPSLRNKPVIVVPSLTDTTSAIAASYEAKSLGIKTGTRVYEAKKICKDIICVTGRHDQYVYYHNKIVKAVGKLVYIEQILSIDEFAIKLTSEYQTEDKIIKLVKDIKSIIRNEVGEYISCSIGISCSRFISKVASEMNKPDGFKIIAQENIQEELENLELSDIPGIGKAMSRRLDYCNIRSMHDLYKCSPKQMRQIWGNVAGEKMWYMLRGADFRDTVVNNRTIGHSKVLAPSERNTISVVRILKYLICKAGMRMRMEELCTNRLILSLKTVEGLYLRDELHFEYVSDDASLLKYLKILMVRLIKKRNYNFIKIGITLLGLKKSSSIPVTLFDFYSQSSKTHNFKKKSISSTIDKINTRYGRGTIYIASANRNDLSNTYTGSKIAFGRIPDIREF